MEMGRDAGVPRSRQNLTYHHLALERPMAVTFDPHPMEVVFPGSHPAQLTTLTARCLGLAKRTQVELDLDFSVLSVDGEKTTARTPAQASRHATARAAAVRYFMAMTPLH